MLIPRQGIAVYRACSLLRSPFSSFSYWLKLKLKLLIVLSIACVNHTDYQTNNQTNPDKCAELNRDDEFRKVLTFFRCRSGD